MQILLIVLVAIIGSSGIFYLSTYSESNQSMMTQTSGMMDMCQSMMNKAPQDVIIKTTSSQIVKIGEESKINLLVTDKNGEPLNDADVILHIEKGTQMTSMNMSMMNNHMDIGIIAK